YAGNFTGGVYVAAGDCVGDGLADIIVSPGREGKEVHGLKNGGTDVRVFRNYFAADPTNPFHNNPDVDFQAFQASTIGGVKFICGATVAAGDVNGDGRADVIVGSGSGMRATVRAFNVASGSATKVGGDLLPFDKNVRGGVFVAAGKIDGDGV